MKKLLSVSLLGLAVSACQPADPGLEQSTGAPMSAAADIAPLIDRNVFFGDPVVAYAALSPTGEYVAFAKPLDGILNVWVKGIDESFDDARPVTNDRKRPIFNYFWSEDGRYILYTQDKAGDENFRVYAVDPGAEPEGNHRVPAARDLTPYANVRAEIIAVPKHSPNNILVALNDRNERLHDVYRVEIDTGKRNLVRENNDNIAGWVADLSGKLRLGQRIAQDGSTEILDVSRDEPQLVYSCNSEEACDPLRYHSDGERVYLMTNKGERDLIELVLFDPASGDEQLVERDPEGEVDFGGAIFSRADDRLLATSYTGDRVRIYPRDDQFARDIDIIRAKLPRGDLFFREPSADDRFWVVKEVLDIDSGPNYLYDRAAGKIDLLYRPDPDIPVEHMASVESVRYPSRDGLEIPAYLTRPKGVGSEALGAVVLPHGGPWARDVWGWNPLAQFLANRGYVVLQPNFRGSTGYGKRFLNLGNKQWGTGSMQHDITDGARWLVEQGIADESRIAIMGGSYGGYATLAGVAFTPDVYAAGVSIVGPSSIITLLNSIPPNWEPVRRMFAVRVGDMEDADELEMLKRQSPLYSADKITAPLMVIQGANDPRVKKAESDQIVVALRDLGREVEYLVAEDEGHGFAKAINNMASYAAVERFLSEHLGGRYQESLSAPVKETLAALTVPLDSLDQPGSEGGGR